MDQSEQTTLNPLNDANTVGRSGNPAAPDLYSCPNCEMQFKSHFLMRRHLDQLCVGTGPTVVVPRSPTTPENFKQDLSQRKQSGRLLQDETPERDREQDRADERQQSERRRSSHHKSAAANRTPARGVVSGGGVPQNYQGGEEGFPNATGVEFGSAQTVNPQEEEEKILEEIKRLHTELYGDERGASQSNLSDQGGAVTPSLTNRVGDESALYSKRPITSPTAAMKTISDQQPTEQELLDEIQIRAKELDRRKEEIQQQLRQLQMETAANRRQQVQPHFTNPRFSQFPGTSTGAVGGTGEYDTILNAIREQDEQLARATESIRDEIRELKRERLQSRERVSSATRVPVIPYQPNNPASQVNALKSAYLMAGGHDSNLVRQMNETMGDAVARQVGMGVGATGERFGPQTYMGVVEPTMPPADTLKLLEFEKENRLIMHELELLRHKRTTEVDIVEKAQRDHYLKMMNTQHEIEALRAEAYLRQIRDYLNPPAPPPAPIKESPHLMMPNNPHYNNQYDSLHSQPYDPTAGFVIFYDFLLNIEPVYDRTQLIVSLYNGPHEVCTARVLPERDCFPQSATPQPNNPLELPTAGGALKFCLLSISQPVQKCRPGPDLTLVVEVQAQSSYVPRQKTIGWGKVLLFDNQLRVLSGRWRTPIRLIPIRADMIVKDLNTIPQCGMMELYYRIANYRDADVQASVKISPVNCTEYKYSPQSFGQPVYYQPNPIPTQRAADPVAEEAQPVVSGDREVVLPEYDPKDKTVPPPPSSNTNPPSSVTRPAGAVTRPGGSVTRPGGGSVTRPDRPSPKKDPTRPPSTTSPPPSQTASASNASPKKT